MNLFDCPSLLPEECINGHSVGKKKSYSEKAQPSSLPQLGRSVYKEAKQEEFIGRAPNTKKRCEERVLLKPT